MTLIEVVTFLANHDFDMTIWAVPPYEVDVPGVRNFGVPPEAAAVGAIYFLEVVIALELLEDWILANPAATIRARCERVISYAINDA